MQTGGELYIIHLFLAWLQEEHSLNIHTSQNGFIAGVAAWSILSRAALHAHDPVVLGVERLFGQRLVTLCTTETLFMPGAPFVAQLLMEETTFLQANRLQRTPHAPNLTYTRM